MRIQRSTSFIVLCAAAGVLLSGCAGLGAGGGAEATSNSSGSESPLQKYWSLLYGGQDQADVDRQNAEVQDKVAECMGEQGFDYVPDTHNGAVVMAADSGLDWTSEDFAKTYGYGITTDPLGMGDGPEEPGADPNADYVASLSQSEQAAYNDALWGPSPPATDAGEPTEYDWKTGGCNGEAQHEVFGDAGVGADPEFEALTDGMNGLYDEVRTSPAVVEKEQDWSDCLADAGFGDFEHKDDAPAAISEEYSALFTMPDGDASASTAAPKADPAALDALRQREIAQATADYGCAQESGYAETLKSEQFRMEQAFIDEHKTELDAMAARYGDASQ
ncbi:hypothetical protein [Herbiconiux ginsengi]|uniref:Uncharacterized protein n=1 Tax=Herbiconiux ginsengi TaxID=381665 RepID=A0A1H3Q0Q1_9MICO|nr:hypothetical protein [Herbiconiux ginsengi]SDZ06289.1 hypothetical protein SAMN05216554_2196 [Herbiconiux ginsengi]